MASLSTTFLFTIGLGMSLTAHADEPPPNYNTPIPDSIMTPDEQDTRAGTLRFFDGLPDQATADAAYEYLTFSRALLSFIDFIPMASLESLRAGQESRGLTAPNEVLIFADLLDSNPLFLTGNTDTVYASSFMDLSKTGPVVVEIPPGCGPGTVNDAYFRFVVDMGAPGPDRGKGGKYLLLPPGYEGDVPEGYFTAQSRSHINWVILRGLLVDGKPDAAVKMFEEGIKIYPLSEKDNPPEMVFSNQSGEIFNSIHANDYTFFEEINRVIQREPSSLLDPELLGQLSQIGIVKGQPFAPSEAEKQTLSEAVAVANAAARAVAFAPRNPDAYFYEGSQWYTAFVGGSYRWLPEDGKRGRDADARAAFFYVATVNTPAMVLKMPGVGSQYALAARDSSGAYLDGSNTYTLTLPANVPAKDFWSIVVYDPQTRSELQTSQPYPSRNSARDKKMVYNKDGSIDLYFGPTPPKGKLKNNWIQTVPGKGWFVLLRLYGPLEPWFEKTWQPGEFELTE